MGKEASSPAWAIIIHTIRLPRAITGVLAGAALAVSGLQMQTLFRNPLADPFVLGISAGASLGVAIVVLTAGAVGSALIAGLGFVGDLGLALAAILGAAAVLGCVLLVSRSVSSVMTLLILGLMFGYATGAFVSILIYFSVPEQIQSYILWTFGSFGSVTWRQIPVLVCAILLGLSLALVCIKPLNALLLGENYARSMGLNVKRARLWILASASILAGATTAFCGPIAFLGLAVPHLCRSLLHTSDHRALMPAVICLGATLALFIRSVCAFTRQSIRSSPECGYVPHWRTGRYLVHPASQKPEPDVLASLFRQSRIHMDGQDGQDRTRNSVNVLTAVVFKYEILCNANEGL